MSTTYHSSACNEATKFLRGQIATLTRERDEAQLIARTWESACREAVEQRDEARQQIADKDREIERLRSLNTLLGQSLEDLCDCDSSRSVGDHCDLEDHEALFAYRAEQTKRESKEGGDD